jgi:hypothetical protein
VGIFREVGDMGVKTEHCCIRRELFIAENLLDNDIESLVLASLIPIMT